MRFCQSVSNNFSSMEDIEELSIHYCYCTYKDSNNIQYILIK